MDPVASTGLRATSLSAFAGYLTLPLVMHRFRGRRGVEAALWLLGPMLVKRVAGNTPLPDDDRLRVAVIRLVFDQDTPAWGRLAP